MVDGMSGSKDGSSTCRSRCWCPANLDDANPNSRHVNLHYCIPERGGPTPTDRPGLLRKHFFFSAFWYAADHSGVDEYWSELESCSFVRPTHRHRRY